MPLKSNLKDFRPSKEKYSRQMKLLSGGLINNRYFPDGVITIYPWDHKIDEWMSERSKKMSRGRSLLFYVLPKVCNLNGCPLDNFVASEVMSVLMVARSILRNDQVTFDYTCPECDTEGEATLKVPDQLERVGEKLPGWPGYDAITMPDCKDVVNMRPITVGEELSIMGRTENERKNCSDTVAYVLAGLVSVGDGKPDNVKEALDWFNAMSPRDQSYLIDTWDKVLPQLGTMVNMKCDHCEHEFQHNLRLDQDFFRREPRASDGRKVDDSVRTGVQVQGTNTGSDKSAGADNSSPSGQTRPVGKG
jgi:hypothetical protein